MEERSEVVGGAVACGVHGIAACIGSGDTQGPSRPSIYFSPFWSYREVLRSGQDALLTQNIANVLAFVPIGFLLGCAFRRMKWWKVLLFGVIYSISIEALQFFLKRGFSEFDDVFHNVLGCMIGFGIYVGVARVVKIVMKKGTNGVE